MKNIERKPKKDKGYFKEIRRDVEKIVDKLGKEIDPKIKEAIVVLKAYNFPTTASCEGHINPDHGLPYPWIQIYSPEPEIKDKEKKKEKWTKENLKKRREMTKLLTEFYKKRDTPFNEQLSYSNVGGFGGFRLQTHESEEVKMLPQKEKKKKIRKYRKEFKDFTKFLKEKYKKDKI